MKNAIIQQLEQEQMKKDIPSFRPGDTVEVKVWVVEGNKKRLQAYEGVVVAIRNRGLHSAFTVRKISNGEGVERVFQTHSPIVDSITVKRRGQVRQANFTTYANFVVKQLVSKSALTNSNWFIFNKLIKIYPIKMVTFMVTVFMCIVNVHSRQQSLTQFK